MFTKINNLLYTAIALLVFVTGVFAQAQPVNLTDPLPVDPDVRIGKLENGMTYYIRKNAKPEKRIELRLAVNIGSLYETDDQQGLAHFCEHMSFNGTKNFKKNELVDLLEKMGVKFGAELNAYTSFAETVYMLQIPTDTDTLLEKGYQVIEDWAHDVSFDDTEIDKERGVIIEEWRLGLGADDRMRKKAFPVIFKDSRYANRIPIGKPDVLKNFKYETIRQFYKDWYRPNLMAVIVVGDLNLDEAERKIKSHFGAIKNPDKPKEREEFGIPDNTEPLISIETDEEATGNNVMFFYKHPNRTVKNLGDYREQLLGEIYTGMLNNRLKEMSQKADAPFIMAYSNYGAFLARSIDAYMMFGMMKENMIDKGFECLLTENERVKRFGFTSTEFERQKKEILTRYGQRAKEFDKTESEELAMDYVRNFLSHDPISGIKSELGFIEKLLPDIKLEQVNELAKKWITDKNFVVMITAPKKEGVLVPAKETILSIIESVKKKEITAYIDKVTDEPLLAKLPKGTKVINKKEIAGFGITELTFENGVQAILKPTDFKNDEILFSAYSPGGSSLASDDYFLSANYAATIIKEEGIGSFDKSSLGKKLAGKVVDIRPQIEELKEGMDGNTTPQDFETLLQLNYLYFTQPRKDTAAFSAFISKMKNQLKFFGSNPQMAFSDTMVKIVSQNHPRAIAFPSEAQIKKIDVDKVQKFFMDRYADASDFKFFIVGNFKVDEIIPLLETYLGGLPSANRKESWKDVGMNPPPGIKEVTFKKGVEPKSMVAIVISDKFDWNYKDRLNFAIMTDILTIRLRESVREDEGGTYGVQTMGKTEQYPVPEYKILAVFGCSPKRAEKLSGIVFDEMKKLIKDGPEEVDLNKVKETLIRERETNLKKNEFWQSKLEEAYFNNDDLSKINEFSTNVTNTTIEDIKQTAIKYLKMDHYVKVVLMPEKE